MSSDQDGAPNGFPRWTLRRTAATSASVYSALTCFTQARHGPGRQQRSVFRRSVFPAMQAAPPPVFRTLHQIRPQRIPLHIPAQHVEMVVFLHRKGLEPALVHVAGSRTMPVRVPAVCGRQRQPTGEPGQLPVFPGPHDQVVREQAIRANPHQSNAQRFLHHPLERQEFFMRPEDVSPSDSAIQHVENHSTRRMSF